jgi:hypothetical protein
MAYGTPEGIAIRQGDVLAGVRMFSLTNLSNPDSPEGVLTQYEYSVVLTQDCDLEQDFRARFAEGDESNSPDKLLYGVLLCSVHPEGKLKSGQHRAGAKQFGRNEWKPVVKNQDPRYQYLGTPTVGTEPWVVDFKSYFMVPCDFLYGELKQGAVKRAVEMKSPYKEHLLQRFAWYLMRVGLPVDFDQLGSA